MTGDRSRKEIGAFRGFGGPVAGRTVVNPMPINPMEICEMGAPDGRFCGFKIMYTYNKETLQCDEFWFPGCTTSDTNANLFGDLQSCQKLADMCKENSTPTPLLITLPPPPSTTWRPLPPPPPPSTPRPPSPPFGGGGMFGGGGGGLPKAKGGKGRGRGGMGGMGGLAGLGGMGGGGGGAGGGGGSPFGPFPGIGLGSALGGPAPTITPAPGEGEDLGLLGLIQQSLQNAQAIKQGGPAGKQAAAAAAGQILQQFTGFDLNNIGGNFGGLFGG